MESKMFDAWAAQAQLPNSQLLKDIGHPTEGPLIAVDAAYFLQRMNYAKIEPTLAAHGGFPLAMQTHIIQLIRDIESTGVTLFFFFDGLDTAFDEVSFAPSTLASANVAKAFQVYHDKTSDTALELFASSGSPDTNTLIASFKLTLQKNDISFIVAPFKAHAQMMLALDEGKVDVVYGPSELFLYGAPKVISNIQLQYQDSVPNGATKSDSSRKVDLDHSRVIWLELDQCLKMLGSVSLEVLQDAMFLVGNQLIEPFPPLREVPDSPPPIPFKELITQLNNSNIFQFCERYATAIRGNWTEKYMRAHSAVKHMVVLYDFNTLKPRTHANSERLERPPSDIHELIGLQLPSEIHHYLRQGLIGPRVLNWIISGKIKLAAPPAGGESEAYRKLVREQLDPWRKQSLALVASTLNRYYQRKEFVTTSWLGSDYDQKFSIKDMNFDKRAISTWRVKDDDLKSALKTVQAQKKGVKIGSLQFVVLSLKDSNFVSKTVSSSKRADTEHQLNSVDEIVCNTIWRTLQLRGYVNDKHELTNWGKFLATALEHIGDNGELAESILVAVELARYGLLDKSMTPSRETEGTPENGSDTDKANCLRVSYLATTGKLIHSNIGYHGPLNYHLLAYHSLITEIRLSLRDSIDSVVLTTFLGDEVERVREDLCTISLALPFSDHPSAGLGILVEQYLDEFNATEDPTDKVNHQKIVKEASTWQPDADTEASLKKVSTIWDAFIVSINSAPANTITSDEKATWTSADAWYKARRPN